MHHINAIDWVDYVRGLASESRAIVIRQHLDSGCSQCTHDLRLWSSLHCFANQEFDYTPPMDRVRMAKTAFAPQARRKLRRAVEGIAQLVFDSYLQPEFSSVRSTSPALKRHLMYEYKSAVIELSVDQGKDRGERLLTGQITDRNLGNVRGLTVSLGTRHQIQAATRSNDFGEFVLEFQEGSNVLLFLTVDEYEVVVIPFGEALIDPS
jgi:hypothetical protein